VRGNSPDHGVLALVRLLDELEEVPKEVRQLVEKEHRLLGDRYG